MIEEKKFTIGIPAYQRPGYTRQSLESCLGQNYAHYEILVSDDSPGDEIEELVREINSPKIRYFRNRPSLGLVGNSNSLLEKAEGEWMVMLANDDALEPDYLLTVNRLLGVYPEAALVRTRYSIVDEKNQLIRIDKTDPFILNPFEYLSRLFLTPESGPWMSLSAVAFPAARLREIGGFKEFHQGHHMDRMAWAELAGFGLALFIDEPLARIRFHRSEITTIPDPRFESALISTFKMKKQCEEILQRMESRIETEHDRECLQRARQRLHAYGLRQMARSLDEGMMGGIAQNLITSPGDIEKIMQIMQLLRLPKFSSCYVYSVILRLPAVWRGYLLSLFREYKYRRWHLFASFNA